MPSVPETVIVRTTNDAQDTTVYPGQLDQLLVHLEEVVQETVIVSARAIVEATYINDVHNDKKLQIL